MTEFNEKLNTILENTKKTNEIMNEEKIREIVKEELTKLWNTSEIPTYKLILERLDKLIKHIEKGKQTLDENIKTEASTSETKEPVMMDISEIKPKLPKNVENLLDRLATLHKKGKF